MHGISGYAVHAECSVPCPGCATNLGVFMEKEVEELHHLFEKLCMDVYRFLSKEPPDLKTFCVFVSSPLPPLKMKQQRQMTEVDIERIMKSDKFHEIYIVLSKYINWYDHELLKGIVEEYGNPPIKQQMQNYCTRVDGFEKRTHFSAALGWMGLRSVPVLVQ